MEKKSVIGIGRVIAWLNAPSPYAQPIGPDGPVPVETGMTNLKVLALLIARNVFKPKVTGWGQFQGPFGLTQTDAFLLMEIGPYLQGMIDALGLDPVAVIGGLLEPELQALATEFEKLAPPAVPLVEPAE